MFANWTIGRKIAAGFAALVFVASSIAGLAIHQMQSVLRGKYELVSLNSEALTQVQRVKGTFEHEVASFRAFLFTRENRFTDDKNRLSGELYLQLLSARAALTADDERALLDDVVRLQRDHDSAMDSVMALRQTDADI